MCVCVYACLGNWSGSGLPSGFPCVQYNVLSLLCVHVLRGGGWSSLALLRPPLRHSYPSWCCCLLSIHPPPVPSGSLPSFSYHSEGYKANFSCTPLLSQPYLTPVSQSLPPHPPSLPPSSPPPSPKLTVANPHQQRARCCGASPARLLPFRLGLHLRKRQEQEIKNVLLLLLLLLLLCRCIARRQRHEEPLHRLSHGLLLWHPLRRRFL